VAYASGQPSGWLSEILGAASGPTVLFVAPVNTSLSPGTYNATVVVTSTASGVTNSPQSVRVTYTVSSASVANLRVTPTSATVSIGGTLQLTASGVDVQGNPITLGAVVWATSNSNVASVNATGLVTGVAGGSATITVTSSGHSGMSAVTVQAPPPASAPAIQLSQSSVGFNAISGGSNPSPASLTITNGGTGTLTGLSLFSINYVQFSPSDPVGWLSQSLSASTAPSTLTLNANVGGIPAGSYSAVVTVGSSAPGLVGGPRNLNVTFTVTSGAPTPGVMHLNPTDYAISFVAAPPSTFSFPAELCNTGDLPFTWAASSSSALLTVSPTSGTVDRTCQTVTVTGDARSIGSGITLLGVVTFTPNAGTRISGQNWINVKASRP
jgi:trimeric autotransporter adhesin